MIFSTIKNELATSTFMKISAISTLFKLNFAQEFEFRLAFISYRLASLTHLIATLLIWDVISREQMYSFGYNRGTLLTYFLLANILGALVFSNISQDVQTEISTGSIGQMLVKPISYLRYWLVRDFSTKSLHLLASIIEVAGLILLIRPMIEWRIDVISLILGFCSVGLAMFLYYFVSLSISFTTFFSPEANGWPQRFFAMVVIELLSGMLFPLHIFPSFISQILLILPPAFLLYHPLQLLLGNYSLQMGLLVIGLGLLWLFCFYTLNQWLLNKGLQSRGVYAS